MNKARRMLTGGWLGDALSIFTRGWFTGQAPEGEPLVICDFTLPVDNLLAYTIPVDNLLAYTMPAINLIAESLTVDSPLAYSLPVSNILDFTLVSDCCQ